MFALKIKFEIFFFQNFQLSITQMHLQIQNSNIKIEKLVL